MGALLHLATGNVLVEYSPAPWHRMRGIFLYCFVLSFRQLDRQGGGCGGGGEVDGAGILTTVMPSNKVLLPGCSIANTDYWDLRLFAFRDDLCAISAVGDV